MNTSFQMVRSSSLFLFIAIAGFLFNACKSKPSGDANAAACDTAHFRQIANDYEHYHFCYPKSWKLMPSKGVFDDCVGELFRDSTGQYKKIFAIKLEHTTNGVSPLGNFRHYIDTSLQLILTYVEDAKIRLDKDTTWNEMPAHVFEFTGTTSNRPFWTSQLVIDGGKRNCFYVLNFQQRLDGPENNAYDIQGSKQLFDSFTITDK